MAFECSARIKSLDIAECSLAGGRGRGPGEGPRRRCFRAEHEPLHRLGEQGSHLAAWRGMEERANQVSQAISLTSLCPSRTLRSKTASFTSCDVVEPDSNPVNGSDPFPDSGGSGRTLVMCRRPQLIEHKQPFRGSQRLCILCTAPVEWCTQPSEVLYFRLLLLTVLHVIADATPSASALDHI